VVSHVCNVTAAAGRALFCRFKMNPKLEELLNRELSVMAQIKDVVCGHGCRMHAQRCARP
jgi:hypothetical protein